MRAIWIIASSVILSSIASLAVNLAFERRHFNPTTSVIQTSRVEIVDKDGNVRALLGLSGPGSGAQPYLSLNGVDGQESIVLGLDPRGDGMLVFNNQYWRGGAVILGHLKNVDDGSESKTHSVEDKSGAWGLRVRSPKNQFTSMGFLNSGKVLTPLVENQTSK